MRTKDYRSSRNRKHVLSNAYLQRLDIEIRWLMVSNGAWLVLRCSTAKVKRIER